MRLSGSAGSAKASDADKLTESGSPDKKSPSKGRLSVALNSMTSNIFSKAKSVMPTVIMPPALPGMPPRRISAMTLGSTNEPVADNQALFSWLKKEFPV